VEGSAGITMNGVKQITVGERNNPVQIVNQVINRGIAFGGWKVILSDKPWPGGPSWPGTGSRFWSQLFSLLWTSLIEAIIGAVITGIFALLLVWFLRLSPFWMLPVFIGVVVTRVFVLLGLEGYRRVRFGLWTPAGQVSLGDCHYWAKKATHLLYRHVYDQPTTPESALPTLPRTLWDEMSWKANRIYECRQRLEPGVTNTQTVRRLHELLVDICSNARNGMVDSGVMQEIEESIVTLEKMRTPIFSGRRGE
jgi:hypothetical protein